MVQTEKSGGNGNSNNMLTLNSSDPFARKQGQSGMCGKSVGGGANGSAFKAATATPQPTSFGASSASKNGQSQQQQQQNGSWGPVFKNKDHFASLHFC